jgi:hypothetical protein
MLRRETIATNLCPKSNEHGLFLNSAETVKLALVCHLDDAFQFSVPTFNSCAVVKG